MWCERNVGMEWDGSCLSVFGLCSRRICQRMDGDRSSELQSSMYHYLDTDQWILGCKPGGNQKSRAALYRSSLPFDEELRYDAACYCQWWMGTYYFRYHHTSWLWRSGRYLVQTLYRIQRSDHDYRSISQQWKIGLCKRIWV